MTDSGRPIISRRQMLGTVGGLSVCSLIGVDITRAAAGDVQWRFQTSGEVFSSPTVVDGTVFVGSDDDRVYAVAVGDGTEQWHQETDSDIVSSPTVMDGNVFVGGDQVYALDAGDGTEQWSFQTDDTVTSSPTVVGRTVFVGSGAGAVYALDAQDGTEQWRSPVSAGVFSSPTVVDGTVFVGSDDSNIYALNAIDGTEQWRFQTDGAVASSPTVVDDTVFIGSEGSKLYALDARDGTEQWAFQTGGAVLSSPTVADKTVFVGSNDTRVYAVDATDGSERWRVTTDSFVRSSPTIADGTVFIGSRDTNVYAVDANSGGEQWSLQTGSSIFSSPTVVDGTVFVGSLDNGLYAIEAGVSGSSEGSRVMLGTLGHRGERADRVNLPSPALFKLTVEDVPEPPAGEVLNLTVKVENTGEQSGTQMLSLSAGDLGSDSVTVSLNGGDSTTETLSLPTEDGDAGEYNATVSTDNDTIQETVKIRTPAVFTVDITETTDPVEGDSLDVTVVVENTGGTAGTRTARLSVSGLGSDSVEVDLDSGRSTIETLSVSTGDGDAGEYNATVDVGADTDGTDVTILTPATFAVDITDVSSSVAGDPLNVTVTIENTGDDTGSQTVELSAPRLGSNSTTVLLDSGRSISETLSLPTGGGDAGEHTVTVEVGENTVSQSTTISEPVVDGGSDDNGLGTPEMTAIGGGGGLALLLGAYALMRRAGNDETEPDRGPETPSGEATASTVQHQPDSDDRETDELLADAGQSLDGAQQSADDGDLNRALALCEEAIDTAEDAIAMARADAPAQVSDAETILDEATAFRETIRAERNARETVTGELGSAEETLNLAATALDSGNPETALDHLDDVTGALDDARETVVEHDLDGLAGRIDSLERRYDQLRERIDDARGGIPTTIPTTPRRSLSYDDIERGEAIGQGGNADVFRGTSTVDGQTITLAVKEPRMSGTLNVEVVERMMEEAETWQKLDDHDHIVSVVDYDSTPIPWIAMEYMDRGHLGQRTNEMSFEQKLWTAIAVTKAVRHAHRRGVAHLDLKPENVLLRSVENAWDVPKVADWGLSKHLLEHSKSIEGLSPQYAAPEQFDDSYGSADDVTDVYQLGSVFYELFTGRPAFEGQPAMVMNRVLNEWPDPPSAVADVPPALDNVLQPALQKSKQERYDSVLYLRDELQELRSSP